ncbi:hypothetical protein DSO57_1013556 [Entomophthora muscae]|uniref:Uncharacterized protein n=1 Tax=Entomophthora muscae TaxID=34485 RepID=A0ACC2RKC8_9FUNG|nr:hypothetical protein DSO57_1013556 [Entomophthora muscae]
MGKVSLQSTPSAFPAPAPGWVYLGSDPPIRPDGMPAAPCILHWLPSQGKPPPAIQIWDTILTWVGITHLSEYNQLLLYFTMALLCSTLGGYLGQAPLSIKLQEVP